MKPKHKMLEARITGKEITDALADTKTGKFAVGGGHI